MRKLATIQRIEELTPIPGADFIVKTKLYNLEWEFVVRKDEFEIGDWCIYFEIDSLLPDKPVFEFMRERKFRVKTIKLKGMISQGLCMPIHLFSELVNIKLKPGFDVTKILGVEKYLTPDERKELLLIDQKKKGFFKRIFDIGFQKRREQWPGFITKTNEERIQNFDYSELLEKYKNESFYITEKLDGQSATFFTKNEKWGKEINIFGLFKLNLFIKKRHFGVCSRNIWLKKEDNTPYWRMARKYNLKKILKKQRNEMIIQGEQCGPGIQDNKYGLSEHKLFIFNIIEIVNGIEYHFDHNEIYDFCYKYSLESVPLIRSIFLPDSIGEMVKITGECKSLLNNKIEREGIVIRLVNCGTKMLSFKVVNPKFLLKYEREEIS